MRGVFSRPLVPSVLLLAALVLVLAWNRECAAPKRQAHKIWHEHESVISDVAMGKRVSLDAFEEAVFFFKKLANVTVPSDHSPIIDVMPTKNSGTALEPLRSWYARNKDRLYWDEEQNEVRLTPE